MSKALSAPNALSFKGKAAMSHHRERLHVPGVSPPAEAPGSARTATGTCGIPQRAPWACVAMRGGNPKLLHGSMAGEIPLVFSLELTCMRLEVYRAHRMRTRHIGPCPFRANIAWRMRRCVSGSHIANSTAFGCLAYQGSPHFSHATCTNAPCSAMHYHE